MLLGNHKARHLGRMLGVAFSRDGQLTGWRSKALAWRHTVQEVLQSETKQNNMFDSCYRDYECDISSIPQRTDREFYLLEISRSEIKSTFIPKLRFGISVNILEFNKLLQVLSSPIFQNVFR